MNNKPENSIEIVKRFGRLYHRVKVWNESAGRNLFVGLYPSRKRSVLQVFRSL